MIGNLNRKLILGLVLVIGGGSLPVAFTASAQAADPMAKAKLREQNDRTVDEAALISKKNAILKLESLVKKERNSKQEADLLIWLAELQKECAEFEFRIANGRAIDKDNQVKLNDYHRLLNDEIQILTQFMQRFPTHPKISRAYYLRGKAYFENNLKTLAAQDYHFLVDKFPAGKDTKLAHLALIDLMMDIKDYRGAIEMVNRLQARPSDRFYALALDRLSWAFYFLNDIPNALHFVEMQITYYRNAPLVSKGVISEKDKALNNIALFYSAGLEAKKPGFTAEAVVPYFEKLAAGADLGKMIIYISYLMRSKAMDTELEVVKNMGVATAINDADKIDLVLVTFENQANKHRYAQLKDSADDLSRWMAQKLKVKADPSFERRMARSQKIVADAANVVQSDFLLNRNSPQSAGIGATLTSLYNLTLKFPGTDLDKQLKINFNLAETSFDLKDYESAVNHYRWVVDNHPKRGTPAQLEMADQASLKAVSARYESLSQKQIFPKELSAKTFAIKPERQIGPEIATWFKWVDEYVYSPHSPKLNSGEVFLFEANRLMYSMGYVEDAVKRFRTFLEKYPKSRYAAPSGALVLDTYVASEAWEKGNDVATDFLKIADWKTTEFYKRVLEVAADTYFKMIEANYHNKAYKDVLEKTEKFLVQYGYSRNKDSCLILAANSALAMKNRPLALSYFARIKDLRPELKGTALLTEASLAEENYAFAPTVKALRSYLALPAAARPLEKEEEKKMKEKIILLTYLTQDGRKLEETGFCTGSAERLCQKYQDLTILTSGKVLSRKDLKEAMAKSQTGDSHSAIWTAIVLQQPKTLIFKDRLAIFERIAKQWANLDSISKYVVLPYLSKSLPENLRLARAEVKAAARLKLNKTFIAKRAKLMEEMENSASKVTQVSWSRIRASTMNELASMYYDFATELKGLPSPKGLTTEDLAIYMKSVGEVTAPFETKGQDLRKKAFTLASESAIEAASFEPIVKSYFDENSDARLALSTNRPDPFKDIVVSEVIDKFDRNVAIANAKDSVKLALGKGLIQAWRDKHWSQIAFYMAESKSKQVFEPAMNSVAEGISSWLAGARGEAMLEFQEAEKKLPDDVRAPVLSALMTAYYQTYAKAKAQVVFDELASVSGDFKNTQLYVDADAWIKTEIPRAPASEIAGGNEALKGGVPNSGSAPVKVPADKGNDSPPPAPEESK